MIASKAGCGTDFRHYHAVSLPLRVLDAAVLSQRAMPNKSKLWALSRFLTRQQSSFHIQAHLRTMHFVKWSHEGGLGLNEFTMRYFGQKIHIVCRQGEDGLQKLTFSLTIFTSAQHSELICNN